MHPEIGAAAEEICGGHMIFAGLGSPVGRVVGVGFDGPVSAQDLDRMEEFYRQHRAPSQIDVCPLTEPKLLEMLKLRGYTLTEFNNVLFRRLDKGEEFPPPPAEAVLRPGRMEEAPVLNAIVQTSFFPDGDAPEGFEEMLAPLYQMPGAVYFAADIEGKTVACGAGLMIPEHGIIALFGARGRCAIIGVKGCKPRCCAAGCKWPPSRDASMQ
jgi:hypothetical protein